jgi:spore coat polysaccharide biosynthesis protein SpsF
MSGARLVTVIQARLGSSRLPGKVLLPLGESTVLELMLERVQRARLAGEIVVATTTDPVDDPIEERCRTRGIRVLRGHPTDLLDRHRQVARLTAAHHVVKIPSDCPLIDPDVIDRVIGAYLEAPGGVDYASNLHPGTWPDGNDVEVFSAAALETAWREAIRPHEREHTTPFLWDHPERFRLANVFWERGVDLSRSHRYVLDYPDDYEVIRRIAAALSETPEYSAWDIVVWLDRYPEVARVNRRYCGVNWYRHHLSELSRISPADTVLAPEETSWVR